MNHEDAPRAHLQRNGLRKVARRHIGALTVCIVLMLGACVVGFVPLPAFASKAPTVDPGITTLLKLMARAANARSAADLSALSVRSVGGSFQWAPIATEEWQADLLPIPSDDAAQAPLAVLHAWHTCESDGDHVFRLVRIAGAWRLGAEIPETDPGGFRVRDHDLTVAIDFKSKAAAITDAVRIERSGDSSVGLMRLSQDFHVAAIRLNDAAGAPVSFRQAGGVLAFAAPPTPAFTLYLSYSGVVNHQGSDYIRTNEAILDSYWYPNIARLPTTATVTTTAPPGWTAVLQGEPVRQKRANDGSTTVTYRNDVPASFLSFDLGQYLVTERAAGRHALTVYLLIQNDDLAERSLDMLEAALTFYEARFGPLPYTRYGVVETRGPFSGALEAYSFATFGANTLPDLIPHELAHSWWGGLVSCTYTRSMWDESFAEYSDDLFRRGTLPSEEYAKHYPEFSMYLARERRHATHAVDAFSLSHANDSNASAEIKVGYGKGASVLRVLEDEIGAATMQRCLAAFIAGHPKGEPAEWPEFAAAVGRGTGQDYGWFFSQWVDRKGLPMMHLANVTFHAGSDDGLVEADILQDGPTYRVKMPVRVEMSDGTTTDAVVDVREGITHMAPIHVPAGALPLRLMLDPGHIFPLAGPDLPGDADAYTYQWPEAARPGM